MRISARVAALATVAAIGLGTIATGTAQAAPATGAATASAAVKAVQPTPAGVQAARSTTVHLTNKTGCTLWRTNYSLAHGIWTQEPWMGLADGTEETFGSESNGFMTGTEGLVQYVSYDCQQSWRNGKYVQLHWANPYVGSNGYDENGTDGGVFAPVRQGGGGDNADVFWTVWGA
ncbi:hypothetical protein [Kitasatospora sp. NPDC085464]|uniref:hypothetical protein n=1 Tax=Kitasatospora sp. NPDC085464 TaxID=3364063 RepID=UPI0037C9ABAC